MPARRRDYIGVFNRSHYEDVLVVKVEKLTAAEAIERRYDEINAFEKLVANSGTRILKFMLNVSKEEQAVRLQERVDDPTKQWKFKTSDLDTRAKWDDYMAAYEIAISRCSTDHAPWHVIPSDRNWVRNAAIAQNCARNFGRDESTVSGTQGLGSESGQDRLMPLDFQTAQENFQDGLLRGFEILTTAQHGINLHGKISVMLGDCPDRKDQMIGINGGKLSLRRSMTG